MTDKLFPDIPLDTPPHLAFQPSPLAGEPLDQSGPAVANSYVTAEGNDVLKQPNTFALKSQLSESAFLDTANELSQTPEQDRDARLSLAQFMYGKAKEESKRMPILEATEHMRVASINYLGSIIKLKYNGDYEAAFNDIVTRESFMAVANRNALNPVEVEEIIQRRQDSEDAPNSYWSISAGFQRSRLGHNLMKDVKNHKKDLDTAATIYNNVAAFNADGVWFFGDLLDWAGRFASDSTVGAEGESLSTIYARDKSKDVHVNPNESSVKFSLFGVASDGQENALTRFFSNNVNGNAIDEFFSKIVPSSAAIANPEDRKKVINFEAKASVTKNGFLAAFNVATAALGGMTGKAASTAISKIVPSTNITILNSIIAKGIEAVPATMLEASIAAAAEGTTAAITAANSNDYQTNAILKKSASGEAWDAFADSFVSDIVMAGALSVPGVAIQGVTTARRIIRLANLNALNKALDTANKVENAPSNVQDQIATALYNTDPDGGDVIIERKDGSHYVQLPADVLEIKIKEFSQDTSNADVISFMTALESRYKDAIAEGKRTGKSVDVDLADLRDMHKLWGDDFLKSSLNDAGEIDEILSKLKQADTPEHFKKETESGAALVELQHNIESDISGLNQKKIGANKAHSMAQYCTSFVASVAERAGVSVKELADAYDIRVVAKTFPDKHGAEGTSRNIGDVVTTKNEAGKTVFTIGLSSDADLGTVFHELSHVYFSLAYDLAKKNPTSELGKEMSDYVKALDGKDQKVFYAVQERFLHELEDRILLRGITNQLNKKGVKKQIETKIRSARHQKGMSEYFDIEEKLNDPALSEAEKISLQEQKAALLENTPDLAQNLERYDSLKAEYALGVDELNSDPRRGALSKLERSLLTIITQTAIQGHAISSVNKKIAFAKLPPVDKAQTLVTARKKLKERYNQSYDKTLSDVEDSHLESVFADTANELLSVTADVSHVIGRLADEPPLSPADIFNQKTKQEIAEEFGDEVANEVEASSKLLNDDIIVQAVIGGGSLISKAIVSRFASLSRRLSTNMRNYDAEIKKISADVTQAKAKEIEAAKFRDELEQHKKDLAKQMEQDSGVKLQAEYAKTQAQYEKAVHEYELMAQATAELNNKLSEYQTHLNTTKAILAYITESRKNTEQIYKHVNNICIDVEDQLARYGKIDKAVLKKRYPSDLVDEVCEHIKVENRLKFWQSSGISVDISDPRVLSKLSVDEITALQSKGILSESGGSAEEISTKLFNGNKGLLTKELRALARCASRQDLAKNIALRRTKFNNMLDVVDDIRINVSKTTSNILAKILGKDRKFFKGVDETAARHAKDYVNTSRYNEASPRSITALANNTRAMAIRASKKGDYLTAYRYVAEHTALLARKAELERRKKNIETHIEKISKSLPKNADQLAKSYDLNTLLLPLVMLNHMGLLKGHANLAKQLFSLQVSGSTELKMIADKVAKQTAVQEWTSMQIQQLEKALDIVSARIQAARDVKKVSNMLEQNGTNVKINKAVRAIKAYRKYKGDKDVTDEALEKEGIEAYKQSKFKTIVRSILHQIRTVSAFCEMVDGKTNGTLSQILYLPMRMASDAYATANRMVSSKLSKVVNELNTLDKEWVNKGVSYSFDGYPSVAGGKKVTFSLGRQGSNKNKPATELFTLLIHTGTRANKEALANHFGLKVNELDGIVQDMVNKGVITKDLLDLVQRYWDIHAKQYAKFNEAYRALNHSELIKERAVPFEYMLEVKDKETGEISKQAVTFSGGYAPIIRDRDNLPNSAEDLNTLAMDYSNPMQGLDGSTKERTTSDIPLKLDLISQITATDKILKYTYLMPPAEKIFNIVNSSEFTAAMHGVDQDFLKSVITPWLIDTVSQRSVDTASSSAAMGFIHKLATNVNTSIMAFNISNTVQNIMNFAPAVISVGVKGLRTGLHKRMHKADIENKSSFMKNRNHFKDESLGNLEHQIESNLTKTGKLNYVAAKVAYYLQTKLQEWMDTIIWSGEYQNKLNDLIVKEGGDVDIPAERLKELEQEAVGLADSAVRRTQGSFDVVDTAALSRKSLLVKFLTPFCNYFIAAANYASAEWSMAGRDPSIIKRIYSRMMIATFCCVIPAWGSLAIRELLNPYSDDDDDDLIKDYSLEPLKYLASMIHPIAGTATNLAINQFTGTQSRRESMFNPPLLSVMTKSLNGLDDIIDNGPDAKNTKNMLSILSMFPAGATAIGAANSLDRMYSLYEKNQ